MRTKIADQHFLWPKAQPMHFTDWFGAGKSSEQIEQLLMELFPGAFPVLYSSARAGMTAVLQSLGLGRVDKVWMPGFSSHCVIDAIGHICTPTPDSTEGISAALFYHQWGWTHSNNFNADVEIIEDSVDSLFQPGASVFATNASYTLWSLPKVIGSIGGGVVFCRTAEQSEKLRKIRFGRGSSSIQGILRFLAKRNQTAHSYWNGAEAMSGELYRPMRAQVFCLLKKYRELFDNRDKLITEILGEKKKNVYGMATRLPSNLPLVPSSIDTKNWSADGLYSAGLRSFNLGRSWPGAIWEKVAPFPVHIDVSLTGVEKPPNGFQIIS